MFESRVVFACGSLSRVARTELKLTEPRQRQDVSQDVGASACFFTNGFRSYEAGWSCLGPVSRTALTKCAGASTTTTKTTAATTGSARKTDKGNSYGHNYRRTTLAVIMTISVAIVYMPWDIFFIFLWYVLLSIQVWTHSIRK
jgi:hypothetical protein